MLPKGMILSHYRLLERIGVGGMGEVYVAEDTRIERRVAIKVVRSEPQPYPNAAASQDATRLFQREMKTITQLDHRNILPMIDFGEEVVEGEPLTYMVMPYRKEGSLNDWLRRLGTNEKLSLDDINHLLTQATDALQHAHDHHIVHQDVKPSNFLIREHPNQPMRPDLLLTDFGVAKLTNATVTASQQVRGTPAFMPPEQWEGKPVPATDQYALAILAYLLMTGTTPFVGGMGPVMHQHFTTSPPPPSSRSPRIPSTVDAVILRALAKRPDERFPSVTAFASAFHRATTPREELQPTVVTSPTPIVLPLSSPLPDLPPPAEGVHSATAVPAGCGVPPFPPGPTSERKLGVDHSTAGPILPSPISPVSPRMPKRSSAPVVVLLVFLAINLMGALIFSVVDNQTRITNANATATSIANNNDNATATYQATTATSIANETATAVAHKNATATAIANVTATAVANANPYGEGGTFVFYDPLTKSGRWSNASDTSFGGSCQFQSDGYHVKETGHQKSFRCNNYSRSFSNFAFEVHMRIIEGNCGGLVWREMDDHFYKLGVCSGGTYSFYKHTNNAGSDSETLASGNTDVPLGMNTLAIVADGSSFTFYLNHTQIGVTESDPDYASGYISVIANDRTQTTEVVYTDALLWRL